MAERTKTTKIIKRTLTKIRNEKLQKLCKKQTYQKNKNITNKQKENTKHIEKHCKNDKDKK